MKNLFLSGGLSLLSLSALAAGGTLATTPQSTLYPEGSFQHKYLSDVKTDISGLRSQMTPLKQSVSPHADQGMITNPDGSTHRYAMSVDIYLSNFGMTTHVGGFGADVIMSSDESKAYSKAFTLNFFQQGYTMGNVEGDNIVIPSGQYVYDTPEGNAAYMYAAYLEEGEDWPVLIDEFVLTLDEEGRYVSAPDYYLIVLTEADAAQAIGPDTYIYCFGTNYVFTPLPANPQQAVMPADAEVFQTQLMGNSMAAGGETVFKDVTVGVKGDKIYIEGLTSQFPDCYLVGTISGDNTITLDSHQYIGYYDEGDFPYIYEYTMVNPIYLYDDFFYYTQVESVTMTYDENKNLLTLEPDAGVFLCTYGDLQDWDEIYWNMFIGDVDQSLTPPNPSDVQCYDGYESGPYVVFSWNTTSVQGIPMNPSNLWCEIEVNGEPYTFTPALYPGLETATDRIYFSLSDVEGLYISDYPTIYLKDYVDQYGALKTVGVKIGYEADGETSYSDLVYAAGFEPFEDEAATPARPGSLVYYNDYYDTFRFEYNNTDVEGNPIAGRLLGVEFFIDGEPLVFEDSNYYFNNGYGPDVTILGLAEQAPNYSSSVVSHYGDIYTVDLWGHWDGLPEFSTLTARIVCYGGDQITYGESIEIVLEREATPANPWDVKYDEDYWTFSFGSLPVDIFGNGLAPWNYGYEVYVNNELYTFDADLYNLDEDTTFIPFGGFEYNYDFYFTTDYVYDDNWNIIAENPVMEISMKEDMSNKIIGVRAVYTDGEGNTTYSNIVTNYPEVSAGVEEIIPASQSARWFNLQGVEIRNPEKGQIYIKVENGKATKIIL